MYNFTREDMPTTRCPGCNGCGLLSSEPRIYCEQCQLGRELKAMDQRISDEDHWRLAQDPEEKY